MVKKKEILSKTDIMRSELEMFPKQEGRGIFGGVKDTLKNVKTKAEKARSVAVKGSDILGEFGKDFRKAQDWALEQPVSKPYFKKKKRK